MENTIVHDFTEKESDRLREVIKRLLREDGWKNVHIVDFHIDVDFVEEDLI